MNTPQAVKNTVRIAVLSAKNIPQIKINIPEAEDKTAIIFFGFFNL